MLIVSKAFDKSKKITRLFSFLLNELVMLFMRSEIAWEVEHFFSESKLIFKKKLCLCKKLITLQYIIFSKILDIFESKLMAMFYP